MYAYVYVIIYYYEDVWTTGPVVRFVFNRSNVFAFFIFNNEDFKRDGSRGPWNTNLEAVRM